MTHHGKRIRKAREAVERTKLYKLDDAVKPKVRPSVCDRYHHGVTCFHVHHADDGPEREQAAGARYLFVCAGDQARITAGGMTAHGTAVLGEVVGRDNAKGVVGIAPDVDRVFTSSIGNQSVADAIDVAAETMLPGDVLLIELQGGGPRGRGELP